MDDFGDRIAPFPQLAYRICLRYASILFASLDECLSAMTKLVDYGGRHVACRYAQSTPSDAFRFSIAKTSQPKKVGHSRCNSREV